ncbi:hypothetical protein [Nocardia wallacei]|uniref:hypothetical protein n=1 Tax=Nocardia wallacei TaxID=480035 RepID=UPI002454B661|nr:hypothetical protein [Nocardia wallacei]
MITAWVLLAVALLGAAAIVAGVAVLFGLGCALIAGGVLALVAAIVLFDPAKVRRP